MSINQKIHEFLNNTMGITTYPADGKKHRVIGFKETVSFHKSMMSDREVDQRYYAVVEDTNGELYYKSYNSLPILNTPKKVLEKFKKNQNKPKDASFNGSPVYTTSQGAVGVDQALWVRTDGFQREVKKALNGFNLG